jgi:apolipoprotein N-acyltransferase
MVLPESALLCYLVRRAAYYRRVRGWVDSTKTPLILGSLHWEKPPRDSYYDYWPYNTAFCVTSQSRDFAAYYKMRLLPFSEAMPFEARVPILSRVNLGESDFRSGAEPVVFDVAPGVRAGPFICYEMIFPALVRQRVRLGANLLVNITNDGWFGRSTAAFHHATMARMRCIENGVAMARCANSGVSMCVDPFGRVLGATRLYTRTILTREVPVGRIPALYTRLGDWPVGLSFAVLLAAGGGIIGARIRRRSRN